MMRRLAPTHSSERAGLKVAAPLVVAIAATLLSGCAAESLQELAVVPVTKYEAASGFSPQGHSVSALPEGAFRITAVGSSTTPPGRVEKMAQARAAEYGTELKKKAFSEKRIAHSIRCGETAIVQKGVTVPIKPADYRVVTLDVTYGDQVNEPALKPTKTTAEALKAELAGQSVPPEEQKQLAAEIAVACKRQPG